MKCIFYTVGFMLTLVLFGCNFSKPEASKKADDVCLIQIKLDTLYEEGLVKIYPYQNVRSAQEAEDLMISKELKTTLSEFEIEPVQAMRFMMIKVNGKQYSLRFFSGPDTYKIQIENDSIYLEDNTIQNEFESTSKAVGYNKMSDIEYKKNLSQEELDFKKNYGINILKAIDSNPHNEALAAIAYRRFWSSNLDTINIILNKFSDSLQSNYYLAELTKRRDQLKKSAIGSKAPEFTLQSFTNDTVSLTSFKGKYVLIDFWAYWCVPCIASFPELRDIRKKYTEEQLSIVSISTDQNKEKWIEAVNKHGLPWPQLIDDESDASGEFAVVAIPEVVLIDPNGIIVYKYDHKGSLTEDLKEFIN